MFLAYQVYTILRINFQYSFNNVFRTLYVLEESFLFAEKYCKTIYFVENESD